MTLHNKWQRNIDPNFDKQTKDLTNVWTVDPVQLENIIGPEYNNILSKVSNKEEKIKELAREYLLKADDIDGKKFKTDEIKHLLSCYVMVEQDELTYYIKEFGSKPTLTNLFGKRKEPPVVGRGRTAGTLAPIKPRHRPRKKIGRIRRPRVHVEPGKPEII